LGEKSRLSSKVLHHGTLLLHGLLLTAFGIGSNLGSRGVGFRNARLRSIEFGIGGTRSGSCPLRLGGMILWMSLVVQG